MIAVGTQLRPRRNTSFQQYTPIIMVGTMVHPYAILLIASIWTGISLPIVALSIQSISSSSSSSAQTPPPPRSASRPIRSVAIIGSGISGLTLAHALTNAVPTLRSSSSSSDDDDDDPIQVSIFDSRKSLDYKLGSGIQLNGGMTVLGLINPVLQRAVMEASAPITKIRARNKSWFGQQADILWEFTLREIIQKVGGETADVLLQENGEAMWFGIMRGALQVGLRVYVECE